jgi:DNA-binding MltR family transcriptional regulator
MNDDRKGLGAAAPPLAPYLPPAFWDHVTKNSHASAAIIGAASIDDALANMIADKFPKLSKALRKRLFKGYGPFASFSVRIDVALAFGIISPELKSDLEALRQIRNAFAHSPENLSLKSPQTNKWLQQMRGYDGVKDPLVFLYEKLAEMREELYGPEVMKLARALGAKAAREEETPGLRSPEQSPPRSPHDPGDTSRDDKEQPQLSPAEKKGLF